MTSYLLSLDVERDLDGGKLLVFDNLLNLVDLIVGLLGRVDLDLGSVEVGDLDGDEDDGGRGVGERLGHGEDAVLGVDGERAGEVERGL